MLASHWYLVFVSLHIGLHLSLFIRGKVATGITLVLAAYGIYAFAARGLWNAPYDASMSALICRS